MQLHPRPLLLSLYQTLSASFWLIPLCMLLAALVLAPIVVEFDLDLAAQPDPVVWPGLRLSVEGARLILSSIAGSMITVATLVFSMTLVALSLVAQQLGPRILQIFMEDRPTQIVLGLFIATFVFAMLVLGSVGFGRGNDFVPTFGVLITGALAIIAFVAIILFVHHIAKHIQADVIIFKTAQKLQAATDALTADNGDSSTSQVDADRYAELEERFSQDAAEVTVSGKSGYVQHINVVEALAVAGKHGLHVTLHCRPGHFVISGSPLMTASPASNVDDDLAGKLENTVALGTQRTREQRVEFEMLALVEIALRALSKGINDPFTAMSCINWLAAGLVNLLATYPDYRIHCDKEGEVRLLEHPQTFERYLQRTFNPIRHAALEVPVVLHRLRNVLLDLKSSAVSDVQRRALDQQLEATDAALKGGSS